MPMLPFMIFNKLPFYTAIGSNRSLPCGLCKNFMGVCLRMSVVLGFSGASLVATFGLHQSLVLFANQRCIFWLTCFSCVCVPCRYVLQKPDPREPDPSAVRCHGRQHVLSSARGSTLLLLLLCCSNPERLRRSSFGPTPVL